jgi:hypothetical protein
VKALFYLMVGFVFGYLTFAFIDGGSGAVEREIMWGVGKLQEGFDAMILWIQNYTPEA